MNAVRQADGGTHSRRAFARAGDSAIHLKAQLVDFVQGLGFDSCRVAAAAPPPHADEFQTWLRDGAHGEMHYMARGEEKRGDPQRVLAGAKSIIVLALNYFQGEQARRSETAAPISPPYKS